VTNEECTSDVLPNTLEAELKAMGIMLVEPEVPEPKVVRDFTFKMPPLDENGEPPW
jgi:hypothetical protein